MKARRAIGPAPVRTGPSINKGSSKQDHGTPTEFVRAVEAKWGPMVADLACTRENAKAPTGYFFPEVDALKQNWSADYWVVKRADMYLTFDRVFRSGQNMARRFCCAGDARAEASNMTVSRVVRVRATRMKGTDR